MYKSVDPNWEQSLPTSPSQFSYYVNSAISQNWQRIQNGYAIPQASTGTPMSNLHGAAYNSALLSNIGIPRCQGGAGMYGGFEAMINYAIGQAMLYGYNFCCFYNNLPPLPYPPLP